MTDCKCGHHDGERSFFCHRHRVKKYSLWLSLCQSRADYFAAWEEGRGPGQLVPLPPDSPLPPEVIEAGKRLGITRRLRTYAAALTTWAAAGFPERSELDCDRIYADYCEPCTFFHFGNCSKCGCKLRSKVAIRSKIRMATEVCPIRKW